MITRKPTVTRPPSTGTSAQPPAERSSGGVPDTQRSSDAEVADFVAKMKALTPAAGAGHGRLIFAMDATMSRAPTWDLALALQADMFVAVKEVGGLDVQLVYFRGHGECRASRWVSDPDALARLMTGVACHGGLHADRQGARPRGRRGEGAARSTRSSMSAIAWRRTSTACARAPASWRCSVFRCSCSRRAMTSRPSAPSAKSRA